MTKKQKKIKITNTIAKLRAKGFIENMGTDFRSNWVSKKKN
jgi:hypothetical protein